MNRVADSDPRHVAGVRAAIRSAPHPGYPYPRNDPRGPPDPGRQNRGGTITDTRVLIVDDEILVRSGLGLIVGSAPDLDVVGDCSGGQAEEHVQRLRPHVVLLDIRMPDLDGISVLRRLRALPDPPAVAMLTTFDSDEYIGTALRAGAAGFLLKDTAPEQLVHAVRVLAAGGNILSPTVTRTVIGGYVDGGGPDAEATSLARTLTGREARRAGPARRGTVQRRDRRPALPRHRHRQGPHQRDPRQARRGQPGPGGGARPPGRAGPAETRRRGMTATEQLPSRRLPGWCTAPWLMLLLPALYSLLDAALVARNSPWWQIALSTLAAVALLWRRRFPVAALLLTMPGSYVDDIWLAPITAVYTVAAERPARGSSSPARPCSRWSSSSTGRCPNRPSNSAGTPRSTPSSR